MRRACCFRSGLLLYVKDPHGKSSPMWIKDRNLSALIRFDIYDKSDEGAT